MSEEKKEFMEQLEGPALVEEQDPIQQPDTGEAPADEPQKPVHYSTDCMVVCLALGLIAGAVLGFLTGFVAPFVAGGVLTGLIAGFLLVLLRDKRGKQTITK